MANTLKISIGSDRRDIPIIDAAVQSFAAARDLPADGAQQLCDAVHRMTAWINDNAYPGDQTGEIEIRLEITEGAVFCSLTDTGMPLAAFGDGEGEIPEELRELEMETEDLRLVNLAGEGMRMSAIVRFEGLTPEKLTTLDEWLLSDAPEQGELEGIEFRNARPDDAEAIAKLLYATYGLLYPHPDFYRPRWLAAQIESATIYSTVVTHNGELIAHQAMLTEQEGGAVESGVGFVHPAYRGFGLASDFFEFAIERMRAIGVPAILSRAVTNHPYSQRLEAAYGFKTTGLLLGSLPVSVPLFHSNLRGALLSAYLPFDTGDRAVSIAGRYESQLAEAYERLGLKLAGSDTDAGLADLEGHDSVITERGGMTGMIGSLLITIGRWDEQARASLIAALRDAVHHKDEIAWCDLDLHSLDADQQTEIIELLRNYDFFYAGLMCFGRVGHDHLRLQSMLSDDIETEKIVLDSDYALSLRDFVLSDRD